MKKTLSDPATVDEIIQRFKKLTSNSGRQWGTMQVTEMLLHCKLANNYIFDDTTDYVKPTIKQRVIQFICFNFLSRIPRNRKGPVRLQTRKMADADKFEEQLGAVIASLERFKFHDRPITSLHAGLGWLSASQWGRISYMHMDHHLRQFNV